MVYILFRNCNKIMSEETYPADWYKSLIVTIFKKGDIMECGNYRGISLISTASKVFTTVLPRRMLKGAEEMHSEDQAGYRGGRSTVDHIFVLRQLIEKTWEYNTDLYCNFTDFTKVFNTV